MRGKLSHPGRGGGGLAKLNRGQEEFYALLEKVPRDDQNHLIEQALRIISSNEPMDVRLQVLEGLSGLDKAEREDVIAQALRLIPQDSGDKDKGKLISTLSEISREDRTEVVTDALSLSASKGDASDAVLIIQGIRPSQYHFQLQRKETIQQVLQFNNLQMPILSRVDVFREIYRLPADQRQAVVSQALRLSHLVEGDEKGAPKLIEALSTIPSQEREERVRAALSLATLKGKVSPDFLCLSTLATLEERPRVTTNSRVLKDGKKISYDGSSCIFEAKREGRTRAAIELLKQNQGLFSPDSISQAVEEFKSYLEKAQISNEDKGKAQQASLSRLCREAPYFFYGTRIISGKELIARLWIFSKGHREKDACRHGMIRALVFPIEENGGRNFLEWQMQLQVIAVLQGRLKGVDIDGIPLTINELVSFLADRGHTTRAALFQEAEEALKWQPTLDSPTFLSELSRFAYRKGLP